MNDIFISNSLKSLLALKETKKFKNEIQEILTKQQFTSPSLLTLVKALLTLQNQPQTLSLSLDLLSKLIQYNYTTNYKEIIEILSVSPFDINIFKILQLLVYSNKIHFDELLNVLRIGYNLYLTNETKNKKLCYSMLQQLVLYVYERIGEVEDEVDFNDYFHFRKFQGLEKEGETGVKVESGSVSLDVKKEAIVEENKEDKKEVREKGDEMDEIKLESPKESVNSESSNTNEEKADASEKSLPKPPEKDNQTTENEMGDSTTDVTRNSAQSSENDGASRNPPTLLHSPSSNDGSLRPSISTKDLYYLDGFIVFRALCRLSMKPATDALSVKSKQLSLELLLLILNKHFNVISCKYPLVGLTLYNNSSNNSDDSNGNCTTFIQAVKQYLLASLSRNTSNEYIVTVMDIFILLVNGMRHVLKKEIEIFFQSIINTLENNNNNNSDRFIKLVYLWAISRIMSNGEAVCEFYLNYDCDADAVDNLFERLVVSLCKISSSPLLVGVKEKDMSKEEIEVLDKMFQHSNLIGSSNDVPVLKREVSTVLPPNFFVPASVALNLPNITQELSFSLRFRSLECLVTILHSLVMYHHNISTYPQHESIEVPQTPETDFESIKHLKQATREGIQLFNYKYKKGIDHLLKEGVIEKTPESIAKFLFVEGLNKKMIGEYLGEGEDFNIKVMHAFVDMMEFKGMIFVDALRKFLQSFRLPGEAQKIDRFMLKFAERFVTDNPGSFVNAETCYVLAYSTIMLNTDLHNPQVKRRMTKDDFVKNNRGISDGKDLDRNFLESIYDEISKNEIKMKEEMKEVKKEKEDVFAKLNQQGTAVFHLARSKDHVKSMIQLIWMPLLAGMVLDQQDSILLCLAGFKSCIHLCCIFSDDESLVTGRNAFVSTLIKHAVLQNATDLMKAKQVECVKTVLEVGYTDGNGLGSSWLDVLRCVSAAEKVINLENTSLPDDIDIVVIKQISQNLLIAMDKIFTFSSRLDGKAIVEFVKNLAIVSNEEISNENRMYSLTKLVEICYYNMNNRIRVEWLNIWAIIGAHFNEVGCHATQQVAFFSVDSLRQLSMKFLEKEELSNFKFQKDFLKPFDYILANNNNLVIKDMVIRCVHQLILSKNENVKSGWKTFFAVLNKAAKDTNEGVVVMAYDVIKALQQVDSFFKQILLIVGGLGANNTSFFPDYIACLVEFARTKVNSKIALSAVVTMKQNVEKLSPQITGAKPSLKEAQSEESIESSTSIDANLEELATGSPTDPIMKFWFPVCFGLYEIVMTCELEVRTKALKLLFTFLKTHGPTFTKEFWEVLSRGVLFPLFDDLKLTRSEKRKFENKEDMTVWLNTTLIEALRQFFDLFTYMFVLLEGLLLSGLLELITVCFNRHQDNDTLAKIGASCLVNLIQKNLEKLKDHHWDQLCQTIEEISVVTTPSVLLDAEFIADVSRKAANSSQGNIFNAGSDDESVELGQSTVNSAPPVMSSENDEASLHSATSSLNRRNFKRDFHMIIIRSVLHLLIIQTLTDLLVVNNDGKNIFKIPYSFLKRLFECVNSSLQFAKKFNGNKALRINLYKIKFMRQLPNLFRQETTAAYCLLGGWFSIFNGDYELSENDCQDIEEKLLENCTDVLSRFANLDQPLAVSIAPPSSPQIPTKFPNRAVLSWLPVMEHIFNGYAAVKSSECFKRAIPKIYPITMDLIKRNDIVGPDFRASIVKFLQRVEVEFINNNKSI